MAKDKGSIDITNVTDEQSFKWIEELLNKYHKDALNVKEEEFIAVIELLSRLEHKYADNKSFKEFVKPLMTAVQKDKYIEYLEKLKFK